MVSSLFCLTSNLRLIVIHAARYFFLLSVPFLQCFDTVGWVLGRGSSPVIYPSGSVSDQVEEDNWGNRLT